MESPPTSFISVAKYPGAKPLTRIELRASSMAKTRVSWSKPALAAPSELIHHACMHNALMHLHAQLAQPAVGGVDWCVGGGHTHTHGHTCEEKSYSAPLLP